MDGAEQAVLVLIGQAAPDRLLQGAFRQALIVEPDPGRARDLLAAHEGDDRISVTEAALSAEDGDAPLVEYNQPGLRGLRAPSAHLKALFPGLRERARHAVRRVSAPDLFQQMGPLEPPVHMWLDGGGEEGDSLSALEAAGLLDCVTQLSLRCGVDPLFEGAWSAGELTRWLQERGFFLDQRDDRDPDLLQLDFIRAPLFYALRKSEAEKVDLQGQWDQEKATVKTQIATLEKARDDAHAHAGELQRQLTDRTERVKELVADGQAAQQQAEKQQAALDEATAEREELRKQVAVQSEVRAHADELQQQLNEQGERVKALVAEEQSLRVVLEEAVTEREALTNQVAVLEKTRGEAYAHAEDLQRQLTDRTNRVKVLVAEGQSLQERAGKLQATLDEGVAEREQLQQQIAALETAGAEARARIDALLAEQDQAMAAQEQMRGALTRKDEQIAALEDSDESIRSDLAVALRMQSLAQSDLRELQVRYREADADRRSQAELLQALTPRLQQAAAQLHLLTQSDPVAAEQLVEVKPVPAKRKSTRAKSTTTKSTTTRAKSTTTRAKTSGTSKSSTSTKSTSTPKSATTTKSSTTRSKSTTARAKSTRKPRSSS